MSETARKPGDLMPVPPTAGEREVSTERKLVQPPLALYVTEDDELFLRSHNAAALTLLTLRVRWLDSVGDVHVADYTQVPDQTRASTFSFFGMTEGYILDVTVVSTGGPGRRGQTFVQAGILRHGTAAAQLAQLFISDYLAEGQAVAWPGGQIRQSVEGPGVLRSVTGTNQAAGVEVSETVPTNARWKLRGFRVQLVTSAVAGTRRVHLVVDDGAVILLNLSEPAGQAASLTRNYNADPAGHARAGQDLELYIPLPVELMLFQGWRIRTITTTLDVGDDYGAPQLLVEEWIED